MLTGIHKQSSAFKENRPPTNIKRKALLKSCGSNIHSATQKSNSLFRINLTLFDVKKVNDNLFAFILYRAMQEP